MKEEKSKGWGIASLVTSILSLLLIFMPYFGLPLAIFALVAAAKQEKEQKTGNATAGKVMGIIGTVLNSIMLIIVIFVLIFALSIGEVLL